jgi:hypothetical protein
MPERSNASGCLTAVQFGIQTSMEERKTAILQAII